MKVLKLALCAAVASFTLAGAASAQTMPDVSFNVGVTSDYVFRGYTQTDEGPAIFGGVDLTSGIFYAGAWASNVDFFDSTDAELDLYAGVKPTLGPVGLDLGLIYYSYINEPDGADYANVELKAAGSVPVGPVTLGAGAYFSPDGFGAVEEALYYEGNAAWSPMANFAVSGAVGRQTYEGGGDYTTWNLGAGYTFAEKFTLDVRYHDTDVDGCDDVCDERVVATLKAAF